jgi:hypothetical protein
MDDGALAKQLLRDHFTATAALIAVFSLLAGRAPPQFRYL